MVIVAALATLQAAWALMTLLSVESPKGTIAIDIKGFDKASPKLFLAVAPGQPYQIARFSFFDLAKKIPSRS